MPPRCAAFGDLYGYVRSYAAPDRRAADEARLVGASWARGRAGCCWASGSARRS